MAKEHEDADIDPKLVVLAVFEVHEKVATGRCFFFTVWHLSVIQREMVGIREGD